MSTPLLDVRTTPPLGVGLVDPNAPPQHTSSPPAPGRGQDTISLTATASGWATEILSSITRLWQAFCAWVVSRCQQYMGTPAADAPPETLAAAPVALPAPAETVVVAPVALPAPDPRAAESDEAFAVQLAQIQRLVTMHDAATNPSLEVEREDTSEYIALEAAACTHPQGVLGMLRAEAFRFFLETSSLGPQERLIQWNQLYDIMGQGHPQIYLDLAVACTLESPTLASSSDGEQNWPHYSAMNRGEALSNARKGATVGNLYSHCVSQACAGVDTNLARAQQRLRILAGLLPPAATP